MNYATQLKAILQASGWSQEELARRLGVSFVTLNSWANGRSEPRKKASEAIRMLYFEILGADSLDIAALYEQKKKAASLKTTVRAIFSDQRVLDKLMLYLTYHTNTIEGSTMTLADTEDVLFHHKVLSNRTQTEQIEARNHQAALLWLLEQLPGRDFVLTEDIVKGLHLRLMNGIIGDAGEYRRHSVRIMGTQVTVTNYLKVPDRMLQILSNIERSPNDPIAFLSAMHANFEKVHPFSDGNGRVGRLLMLSQALMYGLIPPLVVRERKYAYYKYLELAQVKDNFIPLELFIAEAMIESSRLLFGE
jgi:Fic family protein